jgi:hypothetical protein
MWMVCVPSGVVGVGLAGEVAPGALAGVNPHVEASSLHGSPRSSSALRLQREHALAGDPGQTLDIRRRPQSSSAGSGT